jgi:hypothetical protein
MVAEMISLTWILGIVSVLGVGGTIAAYFLIPAFIPVLQSLVAALLRCKPCLYGIAAVLAVLAAFWGGHHQAVLDCRADELAAELAVKKADVDAATQAKDDAIKRANSIEVKASDRQSKDAAYIAALKKRPSCALDNSDIGTGGMSNHGFHLPRSAPRAN